MKYRVSASFKVNAETIVEADTPEAAPAQARDMWDNPDPLYGRWPFNVDASPCDGASWPDDAEAWLLA